MKRLNINCVILLLLIGFCSCSTDETDTFFPQEGHTLTVQFSGSSLKNYSFSSLDENLIEEVDVLVFDATGIEERFLYRVSGENILNAAGSVNGNKKIFNADLKETIGTDKVRLVLLANVRHLMGNIAPGASKNTVLESLAFDYSDKWPVEPFRPFPMWGESERISIHSQTKLEPIVMLRSIVKVDIVVTPDDDTPIGGARPGFIIEKVYVCNVLNKGMVAPNSRAEIIEHKVTNPSIPGNATLLSNVLEYLPLTGSSGQLLTRSVYIPESPATGLANDPTFLIVYGRSFGEENNTFYRIDFEKDSKWLALLRNHCYTINIKKIKNPGYTTFEEAASSRAVNMIFEIMDTDENITDIHFNGQYMLGVDASEMTVDFRQQIGQFVISTNYSEGWQAEVKSGADWLRLVSGYNTGDEGVGLLKYEVNRIAGMKNRQATILLKAGVITKEISVNQYLGANSYVAVPGGRVFIPVGYANADGQSRIPGGALTAELLWSDSPVGMGPTGIIQTVTVSGTGENAVLDVRAGSTEGNALIAVKSGNNILWSWHIWVTEYDIRNKAGYKTNNKFVFMDRNLGALSAEPVTVNSFGLMYQWGRKDPFPGAGDIIIPKGSYESRPVYDKNGIQLVEGTEGIMHSSVPANNLEEAIRNPMTFYGSSVAPGYDWINPANPGWGNKEEKSLYDPCPCGWRVPYSSSGVYSAWNGISGRWHFGYLGEAGYYPVTGSRDFMNGKFNDVGYKGYVWSAAESSSKSFIFSFEEFDINPANATYRASGLPVRCVKEE